jgi:hypothetical protein
MEKSADMYTHAATTPSGIETISQSAAISIRETICKEKLYLSKLGR